MAGDAPQVLPGGSTGCDARPVLPRQRGAMDSRARSRADPSVRGQLFDLPGYQEGSAPDRGAPGCQASKDLGARTGVGKVQPQGAAGQEPGATSTLRRAPGGGRTQPQA